jgi:hypothetical protein
LLRIVAKILELQQQLHPLRLANAMEFQIQIGAVVQILTIATLVKVIVTLIWIALEV